MGLPNVFKPCDDIMFAADPAQLHLPLSSRALTAPLDSAPWAERRARTPRRRPRPSRRGRPRVKPDHEGDEDVDVARTRRVRTCDPVGPLSHVRSTDFGKRKTSTLAEVLAPSKARSPVPFRPCS